MIYAAGIFSDFWAMLYVAHVLLVSIALGIAFFGMPRTLGGTGASRFALGIAAYPGYVGLATTVLVGVLPATPSWVLLTIPAGGAIVGASFSLRQFPVRIRTGVARALRKHPVVQPAAAVIALIVILTAGAKLGANASQPFVEHDSLVYAQEALQLAATRNGKSLARATPEAHVVAAHPHTAIYQAYLAHAMQFGTDVRERLPADLPARIAVQVTIVAMFMGIMALGCLTRITGAATLALALTLVVADFGYLSVASSRDGLRIGSLLILCYMVALTLRTSHRIRRSTGFLLALAAGVAAAAHTLNFIALAMAGVAWSMVAILRHKPARSTVIVAAWAVAGLMVPTAHYIVTFVETGRPSGHGFFYYAYAGTPLWEAWAGSQSIAAARAMGLTERITAIAERGSIVLFIAGTTAAVWLGWYALSRRNQGNAFFSFVAALTLLMLLPLTGIFDFGGNGLAAMHLANFRYFLVWYPLAALTLVALLTTMRSQRHTSAVLIIALCVAGFFSVRTVSHWDLQQPDNIERYGIGPIAAAVAAQPDIGKVWIDHVGLRYYLRTPTVFAYQPPGSEVLRAPTAADAERTFLTLNVTHAVLTEPIKGWWDETSVFRLVSTDDRLVLKSGLHALYRINPSASTIHAPSSNGAPSAR